MSVSNLRYQREQHAKNHCCGFDNRVPASFGLLLPLRRGVDLSISVARTIAIVWGAMRLLHRVERHIPDMFS